MGNVILAIIVLFVLYLFAKLLGEKVMIPLFLGLILLACYKFPPLVGILALLLVCLAVFKLDKLFFGKAEGS